MMFKDPSSTDVTGFPLAGVVDIADQETLTAESLRNFLAEAGATVRHYHSGPDDIMKAIKNSPPPPFNDHGVVYADSG